MSQARGKVLTPNRYFDAAHELECQFYQLVGCDQYFTPGKDRGWLYEEARAKWQGKEKQLHNKRIQLQKTVDELSNPSIKLADLKNKKQTKSVKKQITSFEQNVQRYQHDPSPFNKRLSQARGEVEAMEADLDYQRYKQLESALHSNNRKQYLCTIYFLFLIILSGGAAMQRPASSRASCYRERVGAEFRHDGPL